MRKGKSIVGKSVLSLEDGIILNKVNDVVVDPDGRNVVALVVDEGGFMSSSKVVPTTEVTSYGRDAVVVRGRSSIVSVGDHQELRDVVDREDKILGKRVFTTTGDDQGSISDIYFDERSSQVVGYEVSGGLLGNAARGTSYLATDEISAIGADLIYVEPEVAGVLEGQVGGIQGAFQSAGDKIGQARDAAGQKVGQARDATSQRLEAASGPDGSIQTNAGDSLVGKRTGSDVETDDGSVIVPRGRRIRPEDVEAARAAGKMSALTASVATGAAQVAGADAKHALGTAGDAAGSLWDQFTAKIGQMTDSTGKRIDEEQTKRRLNEISDAIGRPVTKVILDREDNVILNLGDIITHLSIQRAHESGGLDSLLSSVYKGSFEFTKDEMRAPATTEAAATVEKSSGGAVIVEELERKVVTAEREREVEKERKRVEGEAARADRERQRLARDSERQSERTSRDVEPETEQAPTSNVTSSQPAARSGGGRQPAGR